MRCCSCLRNIAAGAEAQKMIVEYEQPDGSVQVRGYMMPDGPLAGATGVMVRGHHSKCFWIAKKREAKGDAVTGRVVNGGPTGYDIDQFVSGETGDAQLTARLAKLRSLAESLGKGVGDAQVTEAFNAAAHGGPYIHHHHHRLDAYQLIAHLQYAHGVSDVRSGGLQDQHAQLHVTASQYAIRQARHADGEPDPSTRDWREQFTAELETEHQ